jgi:hypothetical protein
MRGATQCARRLKQLVRSLRTKLGKVRRRSTGDAVTQMILGIFARDVPESKAREALDRLRGAVVDYNELRVVPPIEMTEMVGALADARMKCEDLSRALNKIFTHEHEVNLDRLRGLSRKEVVGYLAAIDGLDAYSRARVRLMGLQQHAIPLDEAMWAYARKEQIIDRRCPLEEAQAFLERRIAEDEALEVVALLQKQAWAEMGAAVRNREVERITSVPPDRTSRNMLQLVAAGRETAPPPAASKETPARRSETPPRIVKSTAAAKSARPAKKAATSKKKARKVARRPAKSKTPTRPKARPTAKRKAKSRPRKRATAKRKSVRRRRTRTTKTMRTKAAKRPRRSAARAKSA